MKLPIYVISLARATDRRADIVKRLDSAGVEYSIVDAVDGKTDLAPYQHRIRQDICLKHHQITLSDGAVGCVVSHTNLWQRICDEKTEVALILEDDATWDNDFFDIVNQVINCDWGWDMIMLSHGGGSKKMKIIEEFTNRNLVRKNRPGWSAAAYLVRLSGATKILPHCQLIYCGADDLTREYFVGGLQTFDVVPRPAYPTNVASLRDANDMTECDRNTKQRARMRLYRKCRRKIYHFIHPPRKRS